jgi:transposase
MPKHALALALASLLPFAALTGCPGGDSDPGGTAGSAKIAFEYSPPGTDAVSSTASNAKYEIIERRPASLVVARVIKGKFVRKDRVRNGKTDVFVGETPALPIARCLAGPGMLADTIVRRWQDHQPLNRLEGIYARDGMPLARSTMCGWHDQLTPLVQPLAPPRASNRASTYR